MVPVHAVPSGHRGHSMPHARCGPETAHCSQGQTPLLLSSCAAAADGNKAGGHQPLRFSTNVRLSRQSQTATQHPPFGGAEHGVLGDDSFDVHTPLKLAACAHLVNAGMHWELFALVGESHPCPISAATEPSAPEIAFVSPASMSRDGCRGIGFSVDFWQLCVCTRFEWTARALPWPSCSLPLGKGSKKSVALPGNGLPQWLLRRLRRWGQQRRRKPRCRTLRMIQQCQPRALLLFQVLQQSISQQARKPPCPWRPSSRHWVRLRPCLHFSLPQYAPCAIPCDAPCPFAPTHCSNPPCSHPYPLPPLRPSSLRPLLLTRKGPFWPKGRLFWVETLEFPPGPHLFIFYTNCSRLGKFNHFLF